MSNLSQIALNSARSASQVAKATQVVDVIEFCESDWGLNIKLFPVQKIILKAHYGIPLDNDPSNRFAITDWRRENETWYTEAEYLERLYREGRSNIREVILGEERRELVLSIGRRSGKTLLGAVIGSYETYKLISKGDPQEYYGLPPSNNIQIISVATDKDQAGLLYQEVSGHFRQCTFFAPYTANNTMSYARFQTPRDIEKYGRFIDNPNAKSTVKVTFRSCIAKGLRGAGNLVVILDEIAHFTDKGQSSADAVYNAITPSTSTFSPKSPRDKRISIGPVEGRIISISSPLGRQGLFYKLFQIGMKGGRASRNMLCIQAPTWEVNPTIEAEEFEKHYLKDPLVFFTEYGGEFTDRTRGWIEREKDLTDCIVPDARPKNYGIPRQTYFLGLDLGLSGDATAIAIGHIELSDRTIVVDLVDQIKAHEGKYVNSDRLDFDAVADWVLDLSKRFLIHEGMFDQWAGIPLEQALAKRGLKQLKATQMTKILTSQMFQNFKDMMYDRKLVMYDHPIREGQQHCDYITELLELQAEYHSKYVVTVEAPKMEGHHDDRSDALVRMIWVASQTLGKPSYITLAGGASRLNGVQVPRPLSGVLKARKRALASGSHESRMVPRGPMSLSRLPGYKGPPLINGRKRGR